jgi:hypothetical protein
LVLKVGGSPVLSQKQAAAMLPAELRESLNQEFELKCATEIYQQFKWQANLHFNSGYTHWTFLQTQGYIVSQFGHVYQVCAPAALMVRA